MKASCAALAALVWLIPEASTAANDLPGAAQELAAKTAGLVRGPVAATYKNVSSLPDSELARVRREFESALPPSTEAGPPVEARITLSENVARYLLVEEIHSADENQVWIADWNRSDRPAVTASGVVLNKRLVWEQREPILDVAVLDDGLAILTPGGIRLRRGQTDVTRSLTPPKPWPRDLRGRLRVTAGRMQAFLPELVCEGSTDAAASLECRTGDESWVLDSGSRGLLLANFAADRNYFDGRVVMQSGTRKQVAPFYAAASVEEAGGTLWLLALVDGRTQLFDGTLNPLTTIPGWGSDLVGTSARCGNGSQVLATRAGDFNEPDAIQAFSVANRAVTPMGPPVTFAGPVTALWPSGPQSALAVSRDLATGEYAAYVLTMACAP